MEILARLENIEFNVRQLQARCKQLEEENFRLRDENKALRNELRDKNIELTDREKTNNLIKLAEGVSSMDQGQIASELDALIHEVDACIALIKSK